MSDWSPELMAALAGERFIAFAAIDLFTPARDVHLLVNSGYLTFGGNKYVSHDDVFGVFSNIEDIGDGVGNQAPSVTLTLVPPTNVAVGQVANSGMQDSPVKIWLGAVDPVTGLVLGDPALLLDGLLDVPTINIDENGKRSIDYDIGSVFDEFFLADDAARLSNGFHQLLWPGELGCSFVTWVTKQLYWGTEAPDGVSL